MSIEQVDHQQDWSTWDGETVRVADMSDQHLLNAVVKLQIWLRDEDRWYKRTDLSKWLRIFESEYKAREERKQAIQQDLDSFLSAPPQPIEAETYGRWLEHHELAKSGYYQSVAQRHDRGCFKCRIWHSDGGWLTHVSDLTDEHITNILFHLAGRDDEINGASASDWLGGLKFEINCRRLLEQQDLIEMGLPVLERECAA